MTKISIKQRHGLRVLECNGRSVAFDGRITEIHPVSAGRWEGKTGSDEFVIIGGRHSGGASNEWYVQWTPGYGDQYVPVKSAAEALRAIELC